MFKHEDDRRSLIEWGAEEVGGVKGPWKVAKVVFAKTDCVVGDHLHKNKDEMFLLVAGEILEGYVGIKFCLNATHPFEIEVPRGTYHKFKLAKGSILLGLASEPFDPADDHKQ